MSEVIVIGAGFWGSAITRELRDRGHEVTLVDSMDPRSGSRNAAWTCQPWVYRAPRFRHLLPEGWEPQLDKSIEWLVQWMGAEWVTEEFQNLPRMTPHREGRAVLNLTPGRGVLDPDVNWLISAVTGDGPWWYVSERLRARWVVLATGYETDKLLERSGLPTLGVKAVPGHGILIKAPWEGGQREFLVAPYTKYTIRRWTGDLWHLGDTAGSGGAEPLIALANRLFGDGGWQLEADLLGYRPQLPQYTVREHAPHLIVATGGYRMSLGLCGLAAWTAADIIDGK